jgi:hypothetical protein
MLNPETIQWLRRELERGALSRAALGRRLCDRDQWRNRQGRLCAASARSVTLRRGEGIEDVVARPDISSLTSMGLPLMPEGLESEIEPAEMADLLRFIQAQARQSR